MLVYFRTHVRIKISSLNLVCCRDIMSSKKEGGPYTKQQQEERGWYPKWYDGETLFFWKINEHKVDTAKVIQNHPDGDPDDISGEILKRLNRKFQRDKLSDKK